MPTKVKWPDKADRESFEIREFLKVYEQLRGKRMIVKHKGERPDYLVEDPATHEVLGVELTSVYTDDRSVPDRHMTQAPGPTLIEKDDGELERYEVRLVESVAEKVRKARTGYDTTNRLVLSVYVNEYIPIYMGREDWSRLVEANPSVFDDLHPFSEVVFWPLGNGLSLSVTPASPQPS